MASVRVSQASQCACDLQNRPPGFTHTHSHASTPPATGAVFRLCQPQLCAWAAPFPAPPASCTGRYGATTGLATAECSGVCSPGFGCDLASTSPQASICSPGKYSLLGTCEACPAGKYGDAGGLNSTDCSGDCLPGRWGAPAATTPSCSGPCTAGYACPAGSTSAAPGDSFKCSPGQYNAGGASVCSNCPAGLYGATAGLGSSACTAQCDPGFYCPLGASQQTP